MNTDFEKLIGEMDALHKALPKGDELQDEKIEAAARDGSESEEDGEGTYEEAADVKSGKASGKKKPLAKSLTVTLESGETVEAQDGTELVKSLTESLGALTERMESSESMLAKAFGQTVALLKAQNTLITSMQAKIAALANEGRGRRAVVSLTEKPAGGTMAKAQANGMEPNEFMAKAESQFRAGKLSGADLSYIESAFNRGEFNAIPPAMFSRVTAA